MSDWMDECNSETQVDGITAQRNRTALWENTIAWTQCAPCVSITYEVVVFTAYDLVSTLRVPDTDDRYGGAVDAALERKLVTTAMANLWCVHFTSQTCHRDSKQAEDSLGRLLPGL